MSQQNLPLERHFTRSGEFHFDISLKRRLNERRFNTSARLTLAALVNTTQKDTLSLTVTMVNLDTE